LPVLTSQQRKLLDDACVKGRRASEQAVRASLSSLVIIAERPPRHLSEEDRQLRNGLRTKSRQLGDQGDNLDLLIAECAYEQWHRLLFARFLAENNLLLHPHYRAPVTLEDCEELAESLAEPDGWAVAGRFAAEILPGIFRLDDPCVQLRLAAEGRLALEAIVAGLPPETFRGEDALGWVYQFWQRDQKNFVNASERKIGGADLGPVTQLFTENYMVRFLLENSLGAWWAASHPNSPLVQSFDYLRIDDGGAPLSETFEGWPDRVADVTLIDPCCGSGHFLVEAFRMLWRMRAEEDGSSAVDAQDAVIRDSLFGLELDPRCVQIAMFALALEAWKTGGGWRGLPVPNVACSGIPVKTPASEWAALAGGDPYLEGVLARLHLLFRDADTLGSLIDPRRAVELPKATDGQKSFEDLDWEDIAPLLAEALAHEADDPATAVLGAAAAGIVRAADYLSRRYTLIATNVPYLKRARQSTRLAGYCEELHGDAKQDLALAMLDRLESATENKLAVVLPAGWLFMSWYKRFRQRWLRDVRWDLIAHLGAGAFGSISGEVVNVGLMLFSPRSHPNYTQTIDIDHVVGVHAKAVALRTVAPSALDQLRQLDNPDSKFLFDAQSDLPLLSEFADGYAGIQTGDYPRFGRHFWELDQIHPDWSRQQGTVRETTDFGGRENILLWEDGRGTLLESVRQRLGAGKEGAWIRGVDFEGRRGVAVSSMSSLPVSLYTGELFDNNTAVILPKNEDDLPALWAFARSDEFRVAVRRIDTSIKVTNATFVKVPFDVDRWRTVAAAAGHLPEPGSTDPTQWLFTGRPETASDPLQVAVGRLLAFRWPEQVADNLDALQDEDGIVCLPSVRGEKTAAARLQELLARAFGSTWSPVRSEALLADSGLKKRQLDSWLRDDFFRAHCALLGNRPFIWQVWDGRKDGFSALVNYHKLGRAALEKLTYSYVGDWVERQVAGVRDDEAGADDRLAAARALQQKLELVLDGEPPYDIYARWKSLADQPIGWDPDLNDGVRINVRPFVEAGVLRSKFNVKWDKDRGANPDGSERLNDLHFTNAQKLAARGGSA